MTDREHKIRNRTKQAEQALPADLSNPPSDIKAEIEKLRLQREMKK